MKTLMTLILMLACLLLGGCPVAISNSGGNDNTNRLTQPTTLRPPYDRPMSMGAICCTGVGSCQNGQAPIGTSCSCTTRDDYRVYRHQGQICHFLALSGDILNPPIESE